MDATAREISAFSSDQSTRYAEALGANEHGLPEFRDFGTMQHLNRGTFFAEIGAAVPSAKSLHPLQRRLTKGYALEYINFVTRTLGFRSVRTLRWQRTVLCLVYGCPEGRKRW